MLHHFQRHLTTVALYDIFISCVVPLYTVAACLILQPEQVTITLALQFKGVSPSFLKKTQPRLAQLLLSKIDGQSLAETCSAVSKMCKALTSNFAALLGSCSKSSNKTRASKPCNVGLFQSGQMCPLGTADSRPSASNKVNLWAGTFLPQPGGSCTVMACNKDAGSSCFPLSLDLLKPPATSKTSDADVAATVTVTCFKGQLVGDFNAKEGYTLSNPRVESMCGQTWTDTPKHCPYKPQTLAQTAGYAPGATTAARVVSCIG
jgi:hypothetical protein